MYTHTYIYIYIYIYITANTLLSYFVSLKVATHFSCLEMRLIWMWAKVCKYHVFHDILRVCIFLKKNVTSTRPLPIERMTYRDMFHKNLYVSHDQISIYSLSNSLGFFNHLRQLQLL